MAAERMARRRVPGGLRLKAAGVSGNEIARRVGVASSTVRLTLKRLAGAGRDWPLSAALPPRAAGRRGVVDRPADTKAARGRGAELAIAVRVDRRGAGSAALYRGRQEAGSPQSGRARLGGGSRGHARQAR